MDLRQFAECCDEHGLSLFEVRRVDIECYARTLEERGRARATVARRLGTVTDFYRYAEEEGLLAHSPAVHVRRPRLAKELWKFCGNGEARIPWAVASIESRRRSGSEADWWEIGDPDRRRR